MSNPREIIKETEKREELKIERIKKLDNLEIEKLKELKKIRRLARENVERIKTKEQEIEKETIAFFNNQIISYFKRNTLITFFRKC